MYFKNIYYVYFHHGNARSLIQKQYKLLETYKKKRKKRNKVIIYIYILQNYLALSKSNIQISSETPNPNTLIEIYQLQMKEEIGKN